MEYKRRIIGAALIVTFLALGFLAISHITLYMIEPEAEYVVIQGEVMTMTPHAAFHNSLRGSLTRGNLTAYALLVVMWSVIAFWLTTGIKLWDVQDDVAKAIEFGSVLFLLYGIWTG